MTTSPINRTNAQSVLRLFDYCFKQGVMDACNLEDDYLAKEFLDERLADGGYGLLNEPQEGFDWRKWQYTLYRFCRYGRMGTITDTYIDKLHRYRGTYAFAIMSITMRFYLEGIKEYLAYPNPNNTAIFLQNKKVHWDPTIPKHMHKITKNDWISMVQTFVYERQSKAFENDLTTMQYDQFVNCLWRTLQNYPN